MELLKRTFMVLVIILTFLLIYEEIRLVMSTHRSDVISLVKIISRDIDSLNQNGEALFKQKDLLDSKQDMIHDYLTQINETKGKILELDQEIQSSERFGSISKKRYIQLTSFINTANFLTDEYKRSASLLHGCTLSYNDFDFKRSKKMIDGLECEANEFISLSSKITDEMKPK
jgi:hypothetical protein